MFDYQLVARGQGVRVGCFPEQQLIVTKPEPLPWLAAYFSLCLPYVSHDFNSIVHPSFLHLLVCASQKVTFCQGALAMVPKSTFCKL